jgi:hypothetical protein
MPNLTSQIPDLAAVAYSADIPGLPLPVVVGATYAREAETQCGGCPRLGTTNCKVWRRVKVAEGQRAATEHAVAQKNQHMAQLRGEQNWTGLLWRIAHGTLYDFDRYNLGEADENINQIYGPWPLVEVVSANRIRCQYVEDSTNPKAALIRRRIINPEWPIEPEHYLSIDTYPELPGTGILTVGAPSLLEGGEWIVAYFDLDGFDGVVGSTFEIVLCGPDGAATNNLMATKFPADDPDAIAVTYRLVTEPAYFFTEPADSYPLYCVEAQSLGVPAASFPADSLFTIYAGRVSYKAVDWAAYTSTGGVLTDVTAGAVLKIVQTSTPTYTAKVDLSGVSLAGVDSVQFMYRPISSGDDARLACEDRCHNARYDFQRGQWYCGGAGASGREFFPASGACMQAGVCDGWSERVPVNPLDPDYYMQILYSLPHSVEQQVVGVADDSNFRNKLWGPPSVFALQASPAAIRIDPGYHPRKSFTVGGYVDVAVDTSDPDNHVVAEAGGMEVLADQLTYDMTPGAVAVALGPSADPDKAAPYGSAALSDANDPHSMLRAAAVSAPCGFHPYNYSGIESLYNIFGQYQRVNRDWYVWFPALTMAGANQARTDGTHHQQRYDANFQPVESGGIYLAMTQISAGARTDRTRAEAHGGLKRVVTIAAAGAAPVFEAANETENAASQNSAESEMETQIMCAKLVERSPYLKVLNHQADNPIGQDWRDMRVGDVVKFASAQGWSGKIADKQFWVVAIAPNAGAAESYIPPGTVYGGTSSEYYDDYWAFHGVRNQAAGTGSNPAGHKESACRRDCFTLLDENGLIAGLSAAELMAHPVEVRTDGIGLAGSISVWRNHYGSSGADELLVEGTDYLWLGASGQIWWMTDPVDQDGACLIVKFTAADRRSLGLAREHNRGRVMIGASF